MTEHMNREEFACKCGCGLSKISPTVVMICEIVRDRFNQPVIVTSGCRCESHNKKVGGAKESQHKLKGDDMTHAVDIQVRSVKPEIVYNFLNGLFPNMLGLGLYKSWIHIDDRIDRAYRWNKA